MADATAKAIVVAPFARSDWSVSRAKGPDTFLSGRTLPLQAEEPGDLFAMDNDVIPRGGVQPHLFGPVGVPAITLTGPPLAGVGASRRVRTRTRLGRQEAGSGLVHV